MAYTLQTGTIIKTAEDAICKEIPEVVKRGSDRVLNGLITTLTKAMQERYNIILENRLKEIETKAKSELVDKMKEVIKGILTATTQNVILNTVSSTSSGGGKKKKRHKSQKMTTFVKSRKTKKNKYRYKK